MHGNRFKGGGDSPDGLDLKALKVAMFGLGGRLPDVLWDGYVNTKRRAGGAQDLRRQRRVAACSTPTARTSTRIRAW